MQEANPPAAAGGDMPDVGDYQPPAVRRVGTVADLTQQGKTVGAADGSTFLGVDIGSL